MNGLPAARSWRKRLSAWRVSAGAGGLPLLMRDLRELAARPATYGVRVAYTMLISAFVFWHAKDVFQFFDGGLTAMDLGRGREIFDQLVRWQIVGILIVAPVISAGAIAEERQRETLALLLTAQLGPRLIIREKFCSRMFVVSGLVSMSLPLLGFSYSLGGVSQLQLIGSIVLLLTLVMLTVALTVCVSAWCGSTATALSLTGLLGIPVLGPATMAIAVSVVSTSPDGLWVPVASVLAGLAWIFLRVAETALVARASVPARNPVLEVLRSIDRFFHQLNRSLARGRLVISDRIPLPDSEPVTWRHRYHKSLGQIRYLVRILLILELPVLTVCLLGQSIGVNPLESRRAFLLALAGLWIAATALLITSVVGLPGAERTHRTLDVLLTTPISGRDLLRQWMHGLDRLFLIVAVPFLTVLLFRLSTEFSVPGVARFVMSGLVTAVLLSLVGWLSLSVALRIPSQLKATAATALILTLWTAVPPAFFVPGTDHSRKLLGAILSPGVLLGQLELQGIPQAGTSAVPDMIGFVAAPLVGTAFYGLVTWKLRRHCLRSADATLNRC